MPSTIKKIQAENKDSIDDIINIKVVKKLANDNFVIADETGHSLLRTSQDLEENCVYKLLKPMYINKMLEANPKLKLLKSKTKLTAQKITTEDMKKYEAEVGVNKIEKSKTKLDLNNFTKCEELGPNEKTEMLTVLIVSKSGDIAGSYGKYNIVSAKDCNNAKSSIAIYHDKSKIVTVGKLLTFTTLKKTAYKPDGSAYHRLATMWSSRIFEAKEKDAFKNVLMGDEMVTGIILGHEGMTSYESCKKCFTKLADDFCRKCQKDVDEKENNFYVNLYIQNTDSEEDILELFAFKANLEIEGESNDDFTKALDDLTDTVQRIEYNTSDDFGKKKMVKIHRS